MDAPTATPSAPQETPETMSMADRMTNVITSPSNAFEDLRHGPVRVVNWLVPMTLVCVAAIVYICVAFSQPGVMSAMLEQKQAAMQQQVAQGKLTQQQADQSSAAMEKLLTPTLMKILGGFGAIFIAAIFLFALPLVVWLGLKWFAGARIEYMKVVEVYGLSQVVYIIQQIVKTWLVVWKQNLLASASPVLLMGTLENNRKVALLSTLDIIDLWWLTVFSIGLSKVAGVRLRTSMLVSFVIWFVVRIGLAFLSPTAAPHK